MNTILYNANVITMDPAYPLAQAVCIEEGKIKAVGQNDEILRMKTKESVLRDLHGFTLLPGFIDGHSHLAATAYDQVMVNLKPEPSGKVNSKEAMIAAFLEKLSQETLEEGQWLMGMGIDPSTFSEDKQITKYDLDKVSKTIPVVAIHASGHVAYLNSLAMDLVGYTGDFEVLKGGSVPLFPGTKDPQGVLEEAAYLNPKVQNKMKGASAEQVLDAFEAAQKIYASYGITTTQDAYSDATTYPLLKAAADHHKLYLDVVSYVSFELSDTLLAHPAVSCEGVYENHYRIGGVKMFLDGSPQAKTAWLREPYYIAPEGKGKDYAGFPVMEDEEVYRFCLQCIENHWQLHVHCNGDAAADQLLRCYKKAKQDCQSEADLRPVMIHAQTIRKDQIKEMKELGMCVSFFLDHIYYWGDWHYESVLGPIRSQSISPAASAKRYGLRFTLHQDAPVVAPNVMLAIHNAVNRMTKQGRILGVEERITVMDALRAVTMDGAYQYFEEKHKGSITVGKIADLVVLEKDPLQVERTKLKEISVLETIKEGKTIYRKG